MHAIIASAPHTLYRILQHSLSTPLLHTLPTTVNSLNCTDSFWKLLRDIGLWQHPRHLENKTKITTKDDPWGNIATMHNTIKSYSNYYMEIHDKTFLFIAASQKILPNPEGIPYVVYHLTLSVAQFRLYPSYSQFTHFSHHASILYATMACHSSRISLFFISYKQFTHFSYHTSIDFTISIQQWHFIAVK